MKRDYSLFVQFICVVLSGALALAPLRDVSAGEGTASPEGFLFSEQIPSFGTSNSLSVAKSATQGRSAPVSSSGAYQQSIGIDVPPGRLGMTPSLSLSYSSDAGRKPSPVGAGWSLSVPSVRRSTRQGFPPLVRNNPAVQKTSKEVAQIAQDPDPSMVPADIAPEVLSVLVQNAPELEKASRPEAAVAPVKADAFEYEGMVTLSNDVSGAVLDVARNSSSTVEMSIPGGTTNPIEFVAGSVIGTQLFLPPSYDDDRGEFETKDGVLTLSQDGPQGATGKLYQPQREHRSVRYEYRTGTATCPGGSWIEHDPSGTKRYYGCDASGQNRAQVTTELGTFEWLLASEVDPHGNSVDYTYHNIEGAQGQSRLNRYEPQDQPILATVQWGGNARASMPHQYKVSTRVSPQAGHMDALRGHVLLNHKVDGIDVFGPNNQSYWAYDLVYSVSADSGNQLLSEVRRREASQVTRSWKLSYSSNGGVVRWGAPQALPDPVGLAYVQHPWLSEQEYFALLRGARYKPAELAAAIWPWHSRSGVKLMDYNGDGLTDYFYNAAGIVVPQAPTMHLALQGAGNAWHTGYKRTVLPGDPAPPPLPSGGNQSFPVWPEGWETDIFETLSLKTAHDFADINGDNDLEQVGFDLNVVELGDGYAAVGVDPEDELGMCQGLWTGCCESGLTCFPDVSCMFGTGCYENPNPVDQVIHNPDLVLSEMALHPDADVGLADPSLHVDGGVVPYAGAGCSAMAKALCTATYVAGLDELLAGNCGYANPCDPNAWVHNPACAYLCDQQRPFYGRNQNIYIDGERSVLQDWPFYVGNRFALWRKWGNARDDEDARKSLQGDPKPFNAIVSAGMSTQMVDVDGDGLSDLVLLKNTRSETTKPRIYEHLPRTYLNRGIHGGTLEGAPDVGEIPSVNPLDTTQFILDAHARGVKQFSASLNGILLGGRREGCYISAEDTDVLSGHSCGNDDRLHPYPKAQQFSSFFLDLNSDGLPDLVSATPPAQVNGGFGRCQLGHRVHLNRGYRWDVSDELALPGQTWSATGPLTRTKNYSPEPPQFTRNQEVSKAYCDDPNVGLSPEVMVNADFNADEITPADINGDGRVDLLFAVMTYDPATNIRQPKQAVYVNTGRGFKFASNIRFPEVSHEVIVFAGEQAPRVLFKNFFTKMQQTNMLASTPDMGRIVDMNGDTLPDLVVAGTCTVKGPPCSRAQWVPNQNVIPDLLTRAETNAGDWTAVEYVVSSTQAGRQVVLDYKTPPGAAVVKSIRRAAMPSAPVESINLSYAGYVNDPTRSENLGFTMVQAKFKNAAPSGVTASVDSELTVTQFFHRNGEENDADGVASPVPYPLKGLPLEVQTVGTISGTSYSTVQRSEYAIETQGDTARVRQAGNYTVEKRGNLERAVGTEVLAWDEYGYPTRTRSGNAKRISTSNKFAVVQDRQMIEQNVETTSFPRAWVLGLATKEQVSGFTRNEYGVSQDSALLAEVQRTYSEKGLLLSETRIASRATPDCTAGTEDSPVTYTYHPHGLVASAIKGEREMRFSYDSATAGLKSSTHTSWATRYVDGVAQGGFLNTLSESRTLDPRTGSVESVVDANGTTWSTTFDSFGRAIRRVGPSGQVLATANYSDTYPAYSIETTYIDQGRNFSTQTFRDGFGQALASVRTAAGVDPVRTSYVVRDAFGGALATYLPVIAAKKSSYVFADLTPTSSEKPARARYDSFGRQTYAATPDGRETFTDYEPAVTWVTDPKGYATRTEVDWRGNILEVDRYGVNQSSANTATAKSLTGLSYERDGLGKLLRAVDGDGLVHDLAYDGLGRLYKAELPHQSGAEPEMATLCYDEHDDLIEYEDAAGKFGHIERDELGRSVHSMVEDPADSSASVHVYASYDNPEQGRFARGRMWRVLDGSGTRELAYSDLGQIAQVAYSPSNDVRGFGGKLMDVSQVRLTMGYSLMGALTNAKVQGALGGTTSPTVDYGQYNFTLDSLGRATRVAEPSSSSVNLPFGGGNSLIANTAYDAFDSLIGVSLGADINVGWTYEPLSHRLSGARYTLSGETSPFVQLAYTYDKNSNVLSESRKFGSGGTYTKQHTYDALDRLLSSVGTKVANNSTVRRVETMAYSPGGNLLKVNNLTYQYGDPSNAQAVTRVLGQGYQRDLEYTEDGALEYDEDTNREVSLEYDASGCLRRVEAEVGGDTVLNEYICNQEGKRSARLTKRGTEVERVIYIGDLVELRPDDGEMGEVHVRLPLAGNAVFEDVRELRSGLRDEERSGYLVKDIRGSVLAKVSYDLDRDLPRVEYEEAEYSPWGETLSLSTLPKPTHQFVDREPDPGVGYYQFGQRTYDPSLKRWLSPDPLFFGNPDLDAGTGAELNLYAYAANNPATHTDTSGNAIDGVWDAFSLALGVASFKDNVSKGNTLGAVMDGVGIALDGAALLVPFIPGGVGAAIKLVRGADKVNDLRKAEKTTEAAVNTARTADKVKDATTTAKATQNTPAPTADGGTPKVEGGAPKTEKPASTTGDSSGGAGRGGNKLKPDPSATGEHTTFKRDPQNGKVTGHAQWKPNPQNPSGFDEVKRVDVTGGPHRNKSTGETVPTPHTHAKEIPGGVRPAKPDEVPQ
ncbi:MAG: hypothetical protein MUC50_06660 [Myxococcota bacterium]|nr:hypothetical protein [Myxococcota bacterium]